MAKILLGVATALMLISAVFGFLTKSKVTELRQNLNSANEAGRAKDQQITRIQGDLKTSREETAATKEQLEISATELAKTRDEATKAQGEIASLNSTVNEKNAEIERLNKLVASTPGNENGPNPEASAAIEAKLKETESRLAEQQQVNNTLNERVRASDARVQELERAEQRRKTELMRAGLQGQVLAVNPSWNFIVMSLGDRDGVVQNGQLIVTRGPNTIAKVRVTSVEPSSSVADIIPGSVAKGTRVMPGDKVIYPGQ
jgi:flagellar biosynthesis GTPase FlhF